MSELQPGDLVYCAQCERVWIYGDDRESRGRMCRCIRSRWSVLARNAIVRAIAEWQWGSYLS